MHLHFKRGVWMSFVGDKVVIWFPALYFQWAGAGLLFERTEWGAEETPVWEHCRPSERCTTFYPEESGEWYFLSRRMTPAGRRRECSCVRKPFRGSVISILLELSRLKKTSMNPQSTSDSLLSVFYFQYICHIHWSFTLCPVYNNLVEFRVNELLCCSIWLQPSSV